MIHKRQTKIQKTCLILPYSTLKNTVAQYNSWNTGAGVKWTGWEGYQVGRPEVPTQQEEIKDSLGSLMAPHSTTLAWKIPWTEEPGGLQSMRSLRVGHDWVTSLWLFTFMHWRRKWQPTPVFLPGEYQGQRSLVGCCLWGPTESDTTEAT